MRSPGLADEHYGPVHSRLASWRQEHVLRWWKDLTPTQRKQLCRQVESIDLELLQHLFCQTESIQASHLPALKPVRSDAVVRLAASLQAGPREERGRESQACGRRGREALKAGHLAVVLVAGGQGTRLGHDGPKGTFPIGPVSGKSVFQIHAEKVLALSRRYGVQLPLYVMTSPDNQDATREFFADHSLFGLECGQVVFFQQGTMPAVDRQSGKLLLDAKHRIAASPNGHGGVVKALADGGHLADLRRQGIRYIFFYQVDNPLVKVADPAFLGHHVEADAEMSLKVVRKLHPQEKLGVVVEVDGRLQIIEYSDLPAEIANRRLPDGTLEIWAGSIAVHIFNVCFLERLAAHGCVVPYHRAIKKVPCLNESGQLVEPAEANAVKFEMFVFDALPLARNALVVEADRQQEFEPLKNARGENSPRAVRQAMSNLFAEWLKRAGIEVAHRADGSAAVPLEISPLLALDAEELRARLPRHDPVNEPLLLDEGTELVLQE